MAVRFVLLITLGVVVSVFAWCAWFATLGPDRDQYLRQNEALFDSLPVVEGAVLLRSDEYEYSDEDGFSQPDGWTSYRQYAPPDGMTAAAAVASFRERMNPEWRECFGDGVSAGFSRGSAFVSIGWQGPFPNNDPVEIFEIYADHDAKNSECD